MPLFYCKVLRVRISYTINNSLPRQCLLPLEVADDCPQCGICLCVPVPLVIVAFIWIICCGNNCSWPVSSRANPKKDEYCDFFVLVSRIFGIFNHWKLEGKYRIFLLTSWCAKGISYLLEHRMQYPCIDYSNTTKNLIRCKSLNQYR